jgi:hypothetical protein
MESMKNPEQAELDVPDPSAAKTLLSKAGWKKDLKKLKWLFILIALILIVLGVRKFGNLEILGWRLDAKLTKVNYREYNHVAPDFSFRYPDYFQTDDDSQHKYGDNYAAGFKLKSDQRTGCDVRTASAGINFKKSDQEIQAALVKELSQNAKDFKLLSSERMKIGGEDAYLVSFSFTDPIGSTARLSQIMTSHAGENYLLICGTGDYQYQFFSRDFDNFLRSFSWNSGLGTK